MLALCPETPAENPSAPLPFAFRGWMARPRAARFAMAGCARVACSAEISAAVSLLFQLLVRFNCAGSALSAFNRFVGSYCLANSLEFSFSHIVGHRFGGFDEAY